MAQLASPVGIVTVLYLCYLSIAIACNCGTYVPQDPFDPLGPWHQRHLDCGIPTFAYRLPQDSQAKIHAIWLKYEPGDECEEEQDSTRKVILDIPDDVRFTAFKGMCGPGFLKNESGAIRDEFQKVWFDETLSIEQKQVEFRKMATLRLSGVALQKFEKFMSVLNEHKQERQKTIDALSPPAKDAYSKWTTMRKQERLFLASLPADVRAELGLVCKCCGGCKTGKPRTARSVRGVRNVAEVDTLVGTLQRSEQHMLHQASDAECLPNLLY